MKVQILYFEGCPAYMAAEQMVRVVLAREGIEAEVDLVAVNTNEEARRLRFPGSPTIRVDGRDLFPTEEREDWQLGCRVYATPGGLRGTPTADMIRAELIRRRTSENAPSETV
jgi:hypothetical protein